MLYKATVELPLLAIVAAFGGLLLWGLLGLVAIVFQPFAEYLTTWAAYAGCCAASAAVMWVVAKDLD